MRRLHRDDGSRHSASAGRAALAIVTATLTLATFLAACGPTGGGTPHIDVTFDKTPARALTTVTVSVVNFTPTTVTLRLDSPTADPLTTANTASFQYSLDTSPLSDGPHTLYVTANGSGGPIENDVQFGVDNSQTMLPQGFQQSTVFAGLDQPTAVRFAPDGRVFVAEKRGVILVFDSVTDTTPTVFADLRTDVLDSWDRGLLGLALDPNFATKPYVYVLYTRDAPIGGTSPTWNDGCPTPPGATTNGCVASARLARLQANGDHMTGNEQVLVDDWCQQFPSHSIGTIQFGPDGALYAGGGDSASWITTDYGQFGSPLNPCGDAPVPVGGTQTQPNAQGGALRAQDIIMGNDPASLDGSIIRVNPDTGAAMPDNPNASSPDPNTRRIIATGMRNPFRFTFRPGTNELWIGDVGWNTWEEIDRVVDPRASVTDFGWPCMEGQNRQPGYSALNLTLCNWVYWFGGGQRPYYAYNHDASVVPGDGCPTGGSSVSGGVFYNGGNYPSKYSGALFFADYTRRCIWAMLPGSNGLPDPNNIVAFATGTAGAYSPVDLETGPGGDLYYVDLTGGTIRRIRYYAGNRPPVAAVTATPTYGAVPLNVSFDARSSSDADADPLTYSWDLDGNGTFGDAVGPTASFTYTSAGARVVSVRVSDPLGASSVATVKVSAGNTPPIATISAPSPSAKWKVGDTITFSGSGTDTQDGTLPASSMTWLLEIQHCPTVDTCHTHPVQAYTGVSGGSFVAPDHEYPSFLRLHLTVTDSGGLTDSKIVDLYPFTNKLTLQSSPTGATLTLGSDNHVAPFTIDVITGSTQSIAATDQTIGGTAYVFKSWSDGGARTHTITVTSDKTVTATFSPSG
jgi:glucose/arabinose dehydrogenase